MFVGINRLARPATATEGTDLVSLLSRHGFVGASLVEFTGQSPVEKQDRRQWMSTIPHVSS